MSTTIKLKRGENLATATQIQAGEPILDIAQNKLYIGTADNGTLASALTLTASTSGALPVSSGGTGATNASDALTNLGAMPATARGASDGVASLSGGKIPRAQLPFNIYSGTSTPENASISNPEQGDIYIQYT